MLSASVVLALVLFEAAPARTEVVRQGGSGGFGRAACHGTRVDPSGHVRLDWDRGAMGLITGNRGHPRAVHVPMTFRKRGGRKRVVTPDGSEWAPRPQVDTAMVKALARAFRWRKMLDEGAYGTLEDLARAKGVNATYVSRVLRLTLLAPEIVEAILDGRQPAELQLDVLLARFPLEWEGQCSHFG